MTVELVGAADAGKKVVKALPAVVDTPAPDGKCRCLITEVDGDLVVWALSDRGGMCVNGVPVTTKAILHSSDTLRLGGHDFAVHFEMGPRRYIYGLRC